MNIFYSSRWRIGGPGVVGLRSLSLLLLCLAPFHLGASPPENRVPVQAALVKSVEAGRVHVGDPIYARVEFAWSDSGCKLREGAILKGRIVLQTARSKAAKSSEIGLLFESGQCDGRDMKPLPLTVAAVLAPDPNEKSSLFNDQQTPPLSDAVGIGLGQERTGSPMRSMLAAASTVLLEPPRNKPPQVVMPGQVVGIGDLKLGVGKGPEGSSVLTSERHNLRLESGSRFVLVPNVNVTVPAPKASSSGSSTGESPAASNLVANADAVGEPDVCLPPACNVVLGESQPETPATTADFVLSIKQLGFPGTADREMYDLDHDTAISYLGANRLLFTFNPHSLVTRTGADIGFLNLHLVRAVLIDLPTMRVVRTVGWRIHDARQYLWSMGRDSILVHVGAELRVYGPDLMIERRLVLNGPLAFLKVAPSEGYLAIGTVRERHSEAIHRELAEAEGREPEEDIEVRVLDPAFHTLVSVMRSSRDALPVLSEDGEIRTPTIGKNRWRIIEYTWTGQRRVLKQVTSTCRPEVSSLPPDLLFVTGCDWLAAGKWYRILRPDGKLVLKGDSPSTEQSYTASGIVGSSLFAVGITELARPLAPFSAFRSSDLKNLHVSVYLAENGKKLAAMTIPDPLATAQAFAISPDDRHLAILKPDQIAFYTLPAIQVSHANADGQ